MPHPHLLILGYSEAAMYVRQSPPPNITAILSIHDPREFAIETPCTPRLDLSFDDIEVPVENDLRSLLRHLSRQRASQQNGLIETPPTRADAASIIDFANSIRDLDGTLLCHCHAGMSRSPAAALICLSVWRGPNTESECIAEILRLRHGAVPHTGLIRFADELLGRNNQLISALAQAHR